MTMFVPKSLKLNRYTPVDIPSAKEIYARFGFCEGRYYSGDTEVDPSRSKVDMMIHLDMQNQAYLDQEDATAAAAKKLDPTK